MLQHGNLPSSSELSKLSRIRTPLNQLRISCVGISWRWALWKHVNAASLHLRHTPTLLEQTDSNNDNMAHPLHHAVRLEFAAWHHRQEIRPHRLIIRREARLESTQQNHPAETSSDAYKSNSRFREDVASTAAGSVATGSRWATAAGPAAAGSVLGFVTCWRSAARIWL